MKVESQETRILNYLLKGYSLTSLDAFRKFGCFRLASRIFSIRKKYPIVSHMVVKAGKRVAKYSLNHEASLGI